MSSMNEVNPNPQNMDSCSPHCRLCAMLQAGQVDELETVLYRYVWQRFTVGQVDASTHTCPVGWPPWMLFSAVFSGCPVLVTACLTQEKSNFGATLCCCPGDTIERPSLTCHRQEEDRAEALAGPTLSRGCGNKHLLTANSRYVCGFPLTDDWIQQSVTMLMSPVHLACWRLDVAMLELLLRFGADPTTLAHEQIPTSQLRMSSADSIGHYDVRPPLKDRTNEVMLLSEESTEHYQGEANEKFIVEYDNFFYKDKGLSMYHFIALGVRYPPRYSVYEGLKAGVVHNIDIDHRNSTQDFEREHSGLWKKEKRNKSQRISLCFNLIAKAGTDPNFSRNTSLEGHSPLDLLIQPPVKMYYAPCMVKGNQNSVVLRRQDLEVCAMDVLNACDCLMSHGGKLSPKFITLNRWRPALLDFFLLQSYKNSIELAKLAIRLGLFPGLETAKPRRLSIGQDVAASIGSEDPQNTSGSELLRRFATDIANISIRASLISMVLRSSPANVVSQVASYLCVLAGKREFQEEAGDLVEVVRSCQATCLSQHCAVVILTSLAFDQRRIQHLPLPKPLIRYLDNFLAPID